MSVLDAPLVAVAGRTDGRLALTILMHQGYDRFRRDDRWMDYVYTNAASLADGVYLLDGSRSNPLFSWPMYGLVERCADGDTETGL